MINVTKFLIDYLQKHKGIVSWYLRQSEGGDSFVGAYLASFAMSFEISSLTQASFEVCMRPEE